MSAPIPWSEAGSPITWSTIGINWNTAAKANSVTMAVEGDSSSSASIAGIGFSVSFGANVGQTLAETTVKPESVSIALNASQATTAISILPESVSFATNHTSPVTDRLDAVESITFAVTDTSTFGPGTKFTDEPTYPVTVGIAGSTSLLWNEESEVTTTWTKVDYPN